MADPTYTAQGFTNIHPLNTTTGFTLVGGTASNDHGGLAIVADAIAPAEATITFPLPSSPVDGNNEIFVFAIYNSTNELVTITGRFFDSIGNKTEIQITNNWRRGELFFRVHIPSITSFVEDPGFDITDLVDIEFTISSTDNDETDVFVIRRLDYFDLSSVILTGGSNGDPFTLDTIISSLNNDFWGFDYSNQSSWDKVYPQPAGPLLESDVGLQIGDGVAGSTFFDLGTLRGWSLDNSLRDFTVFSGETGSFDYVEVIGVLPLAGRRLTINLGDAQSFPSSIVFAGIFEDISPVAITYRSWIFLNTSPTFGENSILEGCSFISISTTVSGGDSFSDCPFIDSTANIVYQINTALSIPTFERSTFNSPQADYYIDFPSDTPDGTILDFSTAVITVKPQQKVFRANVPDGETITILVSTISGLTDSDVENNGTGTVIISSPSVTFTAGNLTNSEFNNVRCRVSLVPGGAVTQNDNGSIASGGIAFEPSDVNTTSNHITLAGIAGKLNINSVIRVYGSDVPSPLDVRAVYYPSADYTGDNNLMLSASPGGPTIPLTSQGSNPVPDNGFGMIVSPWTELNIQLVTTGAYTFDLTDAASTAGVSLSLNDILVLQAIHHDPAGTGGSTVISNYLEEVFSFQGVNVPSLRSLSENSQAMALISEIGLDGSQVTGYIFDADTPGKVQIDATKTDIDTRELVAYYYFVQWTEAGIRKIRGNIIINNLNSIAIRGALTIQALAKSTIRGSYVQRLDNKSFIADESEQITPFFEDTRAAIVEKEVAINLPEEFAVAIQSIWAITAQLLNKSSGGSGSGSSAADIYNYFNTGTRPDVFKADISGLSTHSAADVWNVGSRTLTAIDKTGYSLSTAERSTLAIEIESALLNESDGQQLIDAIVNLINTNLDLPALELQAIATQVRTELATELSRIDSNISSRLAAANYTAPLDSSATQSAVESGLTAQGYTTARSVFLDKLNVTGALAHSDNASLFHATGFSTHSADDVWTVATRTLTAIDKTGYSLSAAERSTLAIEIESALLNENDGQQLIDAIVNLINNNLDLPALELQEIASQVRIELATELSRIDAPISGVTVDLSSVALETTAQAILTRVNVLPTLTDMEASAPLTAIANLSGVNSALATIQTALNGVVLDARAAKNYSAASL